MISHKFYKENHTQMNYLSILIIVNIIKKNYKIMDVDHNIIANINNCDNIINISNDYYSITN